MNWKRGFLRVALLMMGIWSLVFLVFAALWIDQSALKSFKFEVTYGGDERDCKFVVQVHALGAAENVQEEFLKRIAEREPQVGCPLFSTDEQRRSIAQVAEKLSATRHGSTEWKSYVQELDKIDAELGESLLTLLSLFHDAVELRYKEVWQGLLFGILIWLSPPSLVFAIGVASAWVLAGFRRSDGV